MLNLLPFLHRVQIIVHTSFFTKSQCYRSLSFTPIWCSHNVRKKSAHIRCWGLYQVSGYVGRVAQKLNRSAVDNVDLQSQILQEDHLFQDFV